MHDPNRFAEQDEQERIYAPEQLPTDSSEQSRVRAEGDSSVVDHNEPPIAAPVANLGNAPSAAMAAPNLGPANSHTAPGAPNPEARDPTDTD